MKTDGRNMSGKEGGVHYERGWFLDGVTVMMSFTHLRNILVVAQKILISLN